jgi:RNA polymerase sigma factor (sigma-70 family)
MVADPDPEVVKRFNLAAEDLKIIIAKRRHKWRATSIMEWEDIASELLTRLYQQFHLYDTTRPLDRWANTVITHAIMNLLRDKIYKVARPCISGQAPGFSTGSSYGAACTFCRADNGCEWTRKFGSKSGIQDSSCRFFAAWEKKKKAKFSIATPLSIENHVNESHSMPDDFIDIEAAKKVLDDNIKRRLTKEEYRIYVLLYIKHLSLDEAAQKMGFKKAGKEDMKPYLRVRNASIKIKEVSIQVFSEQGIIR